MSGLHVASKEEILAGRVSDADAVRGAEVLRSEGADPIVVAEIRAVVLPAAWPWAVLAGLEEALVLLEDRELDVEALPEGSVFHAEEPVLTIAGPYLAFGELETALLGVLCTASGVATAAARCRLAAEGRPVYAFGACRVHPAIAPMVDRAAYVGGCDGVSTLAGADLVGQVPVGTMPRALPLFLGAERGWQAFDRVVGRDVPRVAVLDGRSDEREAAVAAAAALGERLAGVRLERQAGRGGDLLPILREVRWELDERGFGDVRLFVSGGLSERDIRRLNPFADAYGVGASIGVAPAVEFSLDLVEVDGISRAAPGALSGRKVLWVCAGCGDRGIGHAGVRLGHCTRCGHRLRSPVETRLRAGRPVGKPRAAAAIRDRALEEAAAAPDPFGVRAT